MIVIGGGLAGLAASVALAEAGYRVRLLEKRPFLGGRAASYVLADGEHVDNCQHVTFGCCTNLQDFYRRSGSADKIRFYEQLVLIDPQGRRGIMRAAPGWPAPIHMMPSFALFSPLGWEDKLWIARAMFDIVRSQGHPRDLDESGGISMLEWLRRRRQTQRALDRFWRVVLVSALSEELDRTDARYGVEVFWKAVLSNRTGYRMGVPTVRLAELYDGCRASVERKGGEVVLRAPVRALRLENGAIAGVRFDDGHEEAADAYVLAIPRNAVAEVLPESVVKNHAAFANLEKLSDAPITGVHLWFDRPVMSERFLTLLESTTQWIFNKTALYQDHRHLFARGAPRSSGRERCQNHQGDGDQGGCGDVLARAGLRSLAAEAADGHSRALPGGRLDKYWLAGDDGRRGPQWLFGRRGHPTRSRNSADILAAGLAGRNLGREYIRERRPTLKKFEEKNVQAAERRRLGSRRREKGSISFSERCAAKDMDVRRAAFRRQSRSSFLARPAHGEVEAIVV